MALSSFWSYPLTTLWLVCIGLFGLALSLLFFFKSTTHALLKTSLLYLCFLPLGALCYLNYYTDEPNHFKQLITKKKNVSLQLEILKFNNSNSFSHVYYAEVKALEGQPSSGKILVYQDRKEATLPFDLGTQFVARGLLKSISPPKNPGGFDFKRFMAQQKIDFQFSIQTAVLLPNKTEMGFFKRGLIKCKQYVHQQLAKSPLRLQSKQMIATLLLGERQALEKSIKEAYADAGVIHLLAISGLHIGILTFFFAALLSPLKRLPGGKLLRGFFLLLFLWGFVFFSGASASVVRAASMFSALVLAQALQRNQNSLHFLTLSFFLLLIFHPPYLHQVGFQMSYAAVFGILWIYPLFKKMYYPNFFLFQKLADALYVCLAAQLAVTPLSIYYFHQFPGLFLLSNLVVVPFFGLFLLLSLSTLLYSLFFSLPLFWSNAYDTVIEALHAFVVHIAKQDEFIFKEIALDGVELVGWYALLVAALLLLNYFKTSYGIAGLVAFLFIQGYSLHQEWGLQSEHALWVLHQNQTELMVLQKGQQAFGYAVPKTTRTETILNDFKRSVKVNHIKPLAKQHLYVFENSILLRLGEEALWSELPQKPTYLLLTNNTKIHLERWIEGYQLELIIADGSNAKWNIERWKKTCQAKQIPFHATLEQGALKINL